MSSGLRTLQKRIFEAKGYKPNNHDGVHGGFETVVVPDTDPVITIEVNQVRWPLTPQHFNKKD